MAKQLGRPNDRGLYSVEKGRHRFWLGTGRREADRRKLRSEQLWELQKDQGGWTPLTVEMAKSIGRGEAFSLNSDNPHEYLNLQQDFPMVTFAVSGKVDEAKELALPNQAQEPKGHDSFNKLRRPFAT
jgi:hypothetical protein